MSDKIMWESSDQNNNLHNRLPIRQMIQTNLWTSQIGSWLRNPRGEEWEVTGRKVLHYCNIFFSSLSLQPFKQLRRYFEGRV